ncbi:uncharacterized protein C1orf21 homolog isoform X1 [Ictalurus furcatus]|uniref:uncharacterized protein C1orf21 homolog isoform X1 n=1 Tax=Ictalurus furcatus TaxID=66913 RepID=UPI002350319A|nr:uncharacterized protein C1orf21 homolog isoform X1 [Ictalurus furcatus]
MGCASAKQVSAVPSDDEGRGKAYSNGDVYSDEYRMKAVEEVKYMRGEEDRVNTRNQENLEKSSAQNKTKLHKEVPGANANKANIHSSESQQEFFRMLDEKIEKILREFFAMRCHVELPVTSMRECESHDTKFNTPAPHSHLRPRSTNKSHDTGEGKWLIGHNLDIFT